MEWGAARVAIALIAFLLMGAVPAGAAPSPEPVSPPQVSYVVDRLTTGDGLPSNSVVGITEAPDGYLWLATLGGLARFDGRRFTIFHSGNSPGLASNRFRSVKSDPEGDLWAVGQAGEIFRRHDGAFRMVARGAPLTYIQIDSKGTVWCLSRNDSDRRSSIVRLEGEALGAQRIPAERRTWLLPDGDGRLWYQSLTGEILSLDATPRHATEAEGLPVPSTLVPFPSAGKVLQAHLRGGRLELCDLGGAPVASAPARPGTSAVLVDARGAVWMSGAGNIEAFLPGSDTPIVQFGAPAMPVGTSAPRAAGGPVTVTSPSDAGGSGGDSLWAYSVFEDRQGTVWIGSEDSGLYRVKPRLFRIAVSRAEFGLVPHALDADTQGNVTLFTHSRPPGGGGGFGGSAVLEGGRLHPIRELANVGPGRSYGVRKAGLIYVTRLPGSGPARGILHVERAGRPPGSLEGPFGIAGLVEDPADPDKAWILSIGRAARVDLHDPSRPRLVETVEDLESVEGGLVDRSGALWILGLSALCRYSGGRVQKFGVADGMPIAARTAYEEPSGTLWFGTYGGGLVRYKEGRFQTIDETRGLSEGFISTMLTDGAGNLWMSGNRGIFRASLAALNAVLDGTAERVVCVAYGRGAGIPDPESAGGSGARTPDGRLWFPTYAGVVVVDPKEALATARPPQVWVERVVDEGRNLDVSNGVVSLAPAHRRFSVEYTAVDLSGLQSLAYRYRLDGVDRRFEFDGGGGSATYTHVPPGNHAFEVEATTDGVTWSRARAPIRIDVPHLFYETWWFLATVAILVVFAGWGAFAYRVRGLAHREQELNRVVDERTRELSAEKARAERALGVVESQARQLEALDEAKSRFFANVSHEFRTPLTLVLGPLDDLQEGLYGELSTEARRQVALASDSAARVLRLVEQLLDTARIESGRLELRYREEDLSLFVRRIAVAFTPLAERKRIAYRHTIPESPFSAWFDAEQLEKVLANLLGNALKFTPSGGTVELFLEREGPGTRSESGRSASAAGGDRWAEGAAVVRVRDDGPGIAPADLPRIFDRFHRAEAAAAREQPGTGIGLSLAKELVDLHHGVLGVESVEGSGSTFWFRIPLGRAHVADEEIAAPRDERTSRLEAAGRENALRRLLSDEVRADRAAIPAGRNNDDDGASRRTAAAAAEAGAAEDVGAAVDAGSADAGAAEDATTVLVVDDHPDVRAYLRGRLERRYRIVEAADGAAALAAARRQIPDLVVSDLMMPGMDGFELLRALRSDPELDFVPVILLTAKASLDSRVSGLGLGADDYLAKPVQGRELDARVDNIIASRRRLRARFANQAPAVSAIIVPAPPNATTDALSPAVSFAAQPAAPTTPMPLGDESVALKLESERALFLDRVRAAIAVHIADEDYGPDALAEDVGQSRRTLFRRVEELLGLSPMELIWKVRLDTAARLLDQNEGSVSEIAYGVGFKGVSHFSKKFRAAHGMSPSSYRDRPR